MDAISINDLLGQISIALDAVETELFDIALYHGKRTALFCLAVGRIFHYDDKHLIALAGSALLHDNALTQYVLSEQHDEQREINMRIHCIVGEDNAKYLPLPANSENFIKFHHERADGSGAFGLKEGQYPIEAEIIALADYLDVNFKLRNVAEDQLPQLKNVVLNCRGKLFSTGVCDAALKAIDKTLLDNMKDQNIHEALHRELPEWLQTLNSQQLMGLAEMSARIVDYKSKFTRVHTVQISNKAWYMASIYGFSEGTRAQFYCAAALHDVGKLFVPTLILEKPGRLTEEEFHIIQSHVQYTWDILKPIRGMGQIANWAGNHHEKLDGSGYPYGKKDDQLDFNSRLLACLDIYQAVREVRPYHDDRSHEETMAILYAMAANNIVDQGICRDLDICLGLLPDGIAPAPIIRGIASAPGTNCSSVSSSRNQV